MGSHCGASSSDERPEAKQVLRRSQDVLAPGAGRPEFRDGGKESDDVLVVLQVFVRLKLTIHMILDGFLLPTRFWSTDCIQRRAGPEQHNAAFHQFFQSLRREIAASTINVRRAERCLRLKVLVYVCLAIFVGAAAS